MQFVFSKGNIRGSNCHCISQHTFEIKEILPNETGWHGHKKNMAIESLACPNFCKFIHPTTVLSHLQYKWPSSSLYLYSVQLIHWIVINKLQCSRWIFLHSTSNFFSLPNLIYYFNLLFLCCIFLNSNPKFTHPINGVQPYYSSHDNQFCKHDKIDAFCSLYFYPY